VFWFGGGVVEVVLGKRGEYHFFHLAYGGEGGLHHRNLSSALCSLLYSGRDKRDAEGVEGLLNEEGM